MPVFAYSFESSAKNMSDEPEAVKWKDPKSAVPE